MFLEVFFVFGSLFPHQVHCWSRLTNTQAQHAQHTDTQSDNR